MNLKPEEMVKALRCCIEHEARGCQDCALRIYTACERIVKRDAAAQIERDQKEIAKLREKVPQWLNVSEKMPTDHLKRYLISFKDAGGGIVDMARYIHGLGWECNNWEVPQELITHWMPLPEPPKEDNHEN